VGCSWLANARTSDGGCGAAALPPAPSERPPRLTHSLRSLPSAPLRHSSKRQTRNSSRSPRQHPADSGSPGVCQRSAGENCSALRDLGFRASLSGACCSPAAQPNGLRAGTPELNEVPASSGQRGAVSGPILPGWQASLLSRVN